MQKLSVRALLSLVLACNIVSLPGSSAAIGMATATGSFQVNSGTVWGNATLFEGSVVETAKASSQLRLNGGAQMRLASASRATVYGGRLVLEKGGSQMESGTAYPVEARSLRIYPASGGTVARVHLAGSRQVLVAALKGGVRVMNAGGVLVANVGAGSALSFDPQAGAAGPTKVSGCLLRKEGKYVVVDQTTNVTFQVQGSDLDKEAGNRVEITGTADGSSPAVAGASQLINVQAVKRVAKGGCASTARKAAAGGAAAAGAAGGAAAAAGIGAATTVAIVGGVATAATVGGLAAAGTFSDEEARPSTSR